MNMRRGHTDCTLSSSRCSTEGPSGRVGPGYSEVVFKRLIARLSSFLGLGWLPLLALLLIFLASVTLHSL